MGLWLMNYRLRVEGDKLHSGTGTTLGTTVPTVSLVTGSYLLTVAWLAKFYIEQCIQQIVTVLIVGINCWWTGFVSAHLK